MNRIATLALAAIATVAASTAANADAVSDQKKAYDAMGIQTKKQPALCKLMSKGEVERFAGGPVKDGVSAGPVSGCAWYLVRSPGEGMLVMRTPRGALDHPSDPSYKKITGVGEQAFTVHAAYGYQADALTGKGITSVILQTKGGSAAKALAALRLVMNR